MLREVNNSEQSEQLQIRVESFSRYQPRGLIRSTNGGPGHVQVWQVSMR